MIHLAPLTVLNFWLQSSEAIGSVETKVVETDERQISFLLVFFSLFFDGKLCFEWLRIQSTDIKRHVNIQHGFRLLPSEMMVRHVKRTEVGLEMDHRPRTKASSYYKVRSRQRAVGGRRDTSVRGGVGIDEEVWRS